MPSVFRQSLSPPVAMFPATIDLTRLTVPSSLFIPPAVPWKGIPAVTALAVTVLSESDSVALVPTLWIPPPVAEVLLNKLAIELLLIVLE